MIMDVGDRNPPDLYHDERSLNGRNPIAYGIEVRTSSIEQTERIRVVANHDCHRIVIEHL